MGIANTSAEIRLSATILDATPPNGHIAFQLSQVPLALV